MAPAGACGVRSADRIAFVGTVLLEIEHGAASASKPVLVGTVWLEVGRGANGFGLKLDDAAQPASEMP
eukprot:12886860-Prorocentrum_lima.AAC.1